MTTIVDYASLSQAIADWTHNAALTSGSPPYSDAFIQRAQAQIERDIPEQNFGNYIRWQEAYYAPTLITTGTAPVPSDWLGAKSLQIADGAGNLWPLSMKAVTWLYNTYPQRAPQGLPAYIARDTIGAGGSSSLISSTQDFTTNDGQTAFSLSVPTGGTVVSVTLDGAYFANGTDYTLTGTLLTLTNAPVDGQDLEITYLASPSGVIPSLTSQFVFGPYPNSSYTLQGTYYAKAPLLSSATTTNWMVVNAPDLLLAACMTQAAKFLKDQSMLQLWQPDYQAQLLSLVNADKAERWAATTLEIDVA